MKKWLVPIFLLLFAASAYGQDVGFRVITNCALITAPVANRITCKQSTTTGGRTAGKEYNWDGSAWVDMAAAGAGTVTSVGAVGTANQIAIVGASPITGSGSWTFSIPTNPTLPGTTTGTFSGSGAALTALNAANVAAGTLANARLNTALLRRACVLVIGDGTNTVADADFSPFKVGRCYVPYNATVAEIVTQSDAGTPTVLVQRRRDAATLVDLLSAALPSAGTTETCAMASTTQTCINGTTSSGTITLLNMTLLAGDWIEIKSGVAGGVAKNLAVAIVFTVN